MARIASASPGAGPLDPAELERYSRLIVDGCIALRPGDMLQVLAGVEHRQLVAALTRQAYRSGAHAVDPHLSDDAVEAARLELAPDAAIGQAATWQTAKWNALAREEVAFVDIRDGSESPDLVGAAPARAAADGVRRARAAERARRKRRLRGTICAWPTKGWASRVYPELGSAKALRRLAEDLLFFCRIGPDDPPGNRGWTEHLAILRGRAAALTKLDLEQLHLRDRGTDLRFAIAPFSVWRGGGEADLWGRQIAMNVPTEECFISPDAAATEGTFECSRPLVVAGRTIEGVRGEFRAGRLVRLKARDAAARDWLADYLASARNADRLGEVALVDASARIAATGRVYHQALIDENAAAHIAFGSGLPNTREGGRGVRGLNRSSLHLDAMIGTEALEAGGITRAGRRVSLVSAGRWHVEVAA